MSKSTSKTRTTRKRRTKTKKSTTTKASTTASKAAADQETLSGPTRVYQFADQLAEETPAQAEGPAADPTQIEPWVMFDLAGEVFAAPVGLVNEVLRVSAITRVPHAPFPIAGIVNVRGRIVPVLNLRVRIGLPDVEPGPKSRILVTESKGRLIGILVDGVRQVVHLDRTSITPAPNDVLTEQSEYITGVYRFENHLLILLDLQTALTIPDALTHARAS